MVTDTKLVPTGTGWNHRIDAVPDMGRMVEIYTDTDQQLAATVIPAEDEDPFMGIGCFVGYHTDEGYFSAEKVQYWRYLHNA